jgi:hypothetical protein
MTWPSGALTEINRPGASPTKTSQTVSAAGRESTTEQRVKFVPKGDLPMPASGERSRSHHGTSRDDRAGGGRPSGSLGPLDMKLRTDIVEGSFGVINGCDWYF